MIEDSDLAPISDINLKIRDYVDRPYVVINAEGLIVSVNLAFCSRFGKMRETLEGRLFAHLPDWPLDRGATTRFIAEVVGAAGHLREREIPLRRAIGGNGSRKDEGFLRVTGFALGNGLVAMFLSSGQAHASDQAKLPASEIIGELRNALSVAAALAAIGLDESQRIESFQVQFFSRLDVLVTVLELLQRHDDGIASLSLDQIVELTSEAAFKGEVEVATSGPRVALGFKDMLVWALILNDIAALHRSPDREVGRAHAVSWSVAEGSFGRNTFRLVWSGPLAGARPPRIGHGTLPSRLVETAFGGTLRFLVQERRLECVIELPSDQSGDT